MLSRAPGSATPGSGGFNALLATLTTTVPTVTVPLVVAQRLRKGACNSARGAKRLVGDAVKRHDACWGPSG